MTVQALKKVTVGQVRIKISVFMVNANIGCRMALVPSFSSANVWTSTIATGQEAQKA
jgi:hypothetical protein